MTLEGMDGRQPMCAGVLLTCEGRILLALGTEDRWEEGPRGVRIPLTGIGGGQEPGETMAECALREAEEELGCPVELVHSPRTIVEDEDTPVRALSVDAYPAPFLFQVQRRRAAAPYRPGLPEGIRLCIGIYHARALGSPRPNDVPGLVRLPPRALLALGAGVDFLHLATLGLEVELKRPAPRGAVLFLPLPSTEDLLARAIALLPDEVPFA